VNGGFVTSQGMAQMSSSMAQHEALLRQPIHPEMPAPLRSGRPAPSLPNSRRGQPRRREPEDATPPRAPPKRFHSLHHGTRSM
jgi:hypothetical protein